MIKTIVLLFLAFIPGSFIPEIDTRVGTAASDSPTASLFGANGEVLGNTIPCVAEPNGMTFWTPQTSITEKKGVSPYYYSDPEFLGFRASHWMVGSATQDYGSFYVIPNGAASELDHSLETALPSYYRLGDSEITGRSHSAMMRFGNCSSVIVGVNSDYGEGVIEFHPEDGTVTAENPVHRIYQGWGKPAGFSGWCFIQFNRPVVNVSETGEGRLLIEFGEPDELLVKMGCSFSSVEGAMGNLNEEIPHWDFDRTRSELSGIWNSRLSRIEVSGGDEGQRTHFYCSLWRASLLPRTVSDCGAPADFDDYSLWDTFRALHPLLTILEPSLSGEMMQALVRKYERGGWLPIFPAWGSYTSAMIGDHAVSAIADAYVKGIRNFDCRKAYEAMLQNAFQTPCDSLYEDGRGRRSLDSYLEYGYIPLEDEVPFAFHKKEQASRTLEYAYDDWCLSRVALKRGHFIDWWKLRRRSENWRNVYDPVTKYPQGRHADGSFLAEDNYLVKTPFITEGTPCHYSWFVPHNVGGLRDLMGAGEFEARLDSMFVCRRYWHGNEPCHQVAYLYAWTEHPEKTASAVRDILKTEYRNTPGGLSGNDDAGQMSAWYIFSCLGFYPVCPGSGEYALGAPAFDRIVIHQENGRDFGIVRDTASIDGDGASAAGFDVRLNGRRCRRPFIRHRQLVRGGTLEF